MVSVPLLLPSLEYAQVWSSVCKVGVELVWAAEGKRENILMGIQVKCCNDLLFLKETLESMWSVFLLNAVKVCKSMGAIPEWLIYFNINFALQKKCFDKVPWDLSESKYSTEQGESISRSRLGEANCDNDKHLSRCASTLVFPLAILPLLWQGEPGIPFAWSLGRPYLEGSWAPFLSWRQFKLQPHEHQTAGAAGQLPLHWE